jgi:hypothetical protein
MDHAQMVGSRGGKSKWGESEMDIPQRRHISWHMLRRRT